MSILKQLKKSRAKNEARATRVYNMRFVVVSFLYSSEWISDKSFDNLLVMISLDLGSMSSVF